MASFTAQNILDENNYTTEDIDLDDLESVIDNAIRHVNLVAGKSIAVMTGAAGSKTASMTDNESVAVKSLVVLLIRGFLDKGPNVSAQGLSVVTLASDPQYSLHYKMWRESTMHLRGRSFLRT